MHKINLYDHSNIGTLNWPQPAEMCEEARLGVQYLLPLIKEGPESFISNAKTHLYLLTIDDHLIPITVNDTEYENSYLLSSYFVVANLKERLEQGSKILNICVRPAMHSLQKMVKWMKINKSVIINNWLLSTNPYPPFSASQLESITLFLKKRFPHHCLMFRSINTYLDSTVFKNLSQLNYRMIPSRQVYLYDPHREIDKNAKRKQKKDLNRLIKGQYRVETVDILTDDEIDRLLLLYQNIYITKYTKYSPRYTRKYLQTVLREKILKIKLLKKNETIYGVVGFLQKNGFLLVPFFGYDTSLPQEEGLYRMLSSVIIEEIYQRNIVSHQGSGAAHFKKWRGFIEHQEYLAIYDAHLPSLQRFFWFLGEKTTPLFNR